MAKIAYIEKKFRSERTQLIDTCNDVITVFQAQGFTLTLRQLYYQLVSRDVIENSQKSYKRLGDLVNDARLAGLIDWEAIEDRGRNLRSNTTWNDPAEIIKAAASGYMLDRWMGQDYRPEVWIEKDALIGVIADVCEELDVPYFACRGYNSQSEQWRAGRRFQSYIDRGQTPIVLHLGDHDSSGLDMTRDNRERLAMFMGGVEVRRLALNMNQVEMYNPPPNPAKEDDTRFAGYAEEFGDQSWELDALEPSVIIDLIKSAVVDLRNDGVYNHVLDMEAQQRAELETLRKNWQSVSKYLQSIGNRG